MKAKVRLLWMKLHAYFSCFFLPLTLIYILSGVLYMFDIRGDVRQEYTYPVGIEKMPESESAAQEIVSEILAENDHMSLPSDYSDRRGAHNWYGFKQQVSLQAAKESEGFEVIVKEFDIFRSFLMIHKGHAGIWFWVLGIFLGLSLTFSLVSGVIITLQLPQLKKPSLAMIGAGLASFVVFFITGV